MNVSFVEALNDPNFFANLPELGDLSTWRNWIVAEKAARGLPLDDDELDVFRRYTGRETPREGGYPVVVRIVGVQSGKSTIVALDGAYDAAEAIVEGTRDVYVVLVAQDLRGAQRALFAKVRRVIEASPLLSREVVRQTATEIELTGGVVIAVYPCRPEAVRGIRAISCNADELGFFQRTDGRPTDVEMIRVLRTRVATTGGALRILSSPGMAQGALYDFDRTHYGVADS